MKGGDAIASGSQGCVFVPKLVLDPSSTAKTSTTQANRDFASKVFTNQEHYRDETRVLSMMRDVSDEGTVTIAPNSFTAPGGLHPVEQISAGRQGGPACRTASVKESDVYVMQMPRIDGDLYHSAPLENSKPISFLYKAYNALMRMRYAGVVHGDMARRNIFFKGEDALIGDFGYSITLNDPNPATNGLNRWMNVFIRPFNASNPANIQYALNYFFQFDQVTIEVFFALYIYANWARKDAIIHEYGVNEQSAIYHNIKIGVFDTSPGDDRNTGILKLNGERCIDGLNKVFSDAATIVSAEEFWRKIRLLLLTSDIKRFMLSAIKFINITPEEKTTLLREIVCNTKAVFFYRFAGLEIPDDILRRLPRSIFTPAELARIPATGGRRHRTRGRRNRTRDRRHPRRNSRHRK